MNLKQSDVDLMKYRLSRSNECLQEAKLLFDAGHYIATINRLYYSCFYSVLALLQTKGLSSKKHSGIRALFNLEFIKTEEIPKEWSVFYADLFENRQEGDYAEFVQFHREDVMLFMEQTQQFNDMILQKVNKFIDKQK